jgi:hypothetical protein
MKGDCAPQSMYACIDQICALGFRKTLCIVTVDELASVGKVCAMATNVTNTNAA